MSTTWLLVSNTRELRVGEFEFPSSTSRSPSPSTSAAMIEFVCALPPGSTKLGDEVKVVLVTVPPPALSSTRLGRPKFPSSTSRSPSPSRSAAAIECVISPATYGRSMRVVDPPPALSSTRQGPPSIATSTSRSPSPSTSATAIDFVFALPPGSMVLRNRATIWVLPSGEDARAIRANGLGRRRHPGSEDDVFQSRTPFKEHAGGRSAALTPGAGFGRAGLGMATQPTRPGAEQLGGANAVG